MTRTEITEHILNIFALRFEIENPGLDDDLRSEHEFDSIDAIELLSELEGVLESTLTREEKKQAMEITTINQIIDYALTLAATRSTT